MKLAFALVVTRLAFVNGQFLDDPAVCDICSGSFISGSINDEVGVTEDCFKALAFSSVDLNAIPACAFDFYYLPDVSVACKAAISNALSCNPVLPDPVVCDICSGSFNDEVGVTEDCAKAVSFSSVDPEAEPDVIAACDGIYYPADVSVACQTAISNALSCNPVLPDPVVCDRCSGSFNDEAGVTDDCFEALAFSSVDLNAIPACGGIYYPFDDYYFPPNLSVACQTAISNALSCNPVLPGPVVCDICSGSFNDDVGVTEDCFEAVLFSSVDLSAIQACAFLYYDDFIYYPPTDVSVACQTAISNALSCNPVLPDPEVCDICSGSFNDEVGVTEDCAKAIFFSSVNTEAIPACDDIYYFTDVPVACKTAVFNALSCVFEEPSSSSKSPKARKAAKATKAGKSSKSSTSKLLKSSK